MNKKLWMALAASAMLTACDYNDEYFEGYDDQEITDIKEGSIDFTAWDALPSSSKPAKNKYFSSRDKAADYLPKWLDKTYFTADNGSTFKVTFDYKEDRTKMHDRYYKTEYHKFTSSDYLEANSGKYGNFLNKKSKVYKALNKKYPNAGDFTRVFVEYDYAEDGVLLDKAPAFTYDFESLKEGKVESIKNWFVSAKGNSWECKFYDSNKYIQYSAFKAGACEAWLVAPKQAVNNADMKFSFEVNVGHYNADCFSVLISTDFDGKDVSKATWTDITRKFNIKKPRKGQKYTEFHNPGTLTLSDYVGKQVSVAFKYVGDGKNNKSTTYQIDNVFFGEQELPKVETKPYYKLYVKKDNRWNEDKEDAMMYPLAYDYKDMGLSESKLYFNEEVSADAYMPAYLAKKVQYPVEGQEMIVVYKYYDGRDKRVEVRADSYLYSAAQTRWVKNTYMSRKTEQYKKTDGVWKYDPSVVIALPVKKNMPQVSKYYQAIVDWVFENIDKKKYGVTEQGKGFVTKFAAPEGSEFYFGASAYHNNINMSLGDFNKQVGNSSVEEIKNAYKDMDDKKLQELVLSRVPEAFLHSLEALHADAEPVEGMDVTYTITFGTYAGKAGSKNWQIVYKVVGKGQFEYVDKSLKELE